MNIEAYNLDSLRTLVRKLQKENETLKRKLSDANIPYEDSNFFSNISDNKDFDPDQGGRIIHPKYISADMAKRFYSMFWAREDVYAKRGKSGGYFPQCDNRWNDRLCPKQRGEKKFCNECDNKKWTRLDVNKIILHLLGYKADGTDVIGVYPLFPDGTCRFLVFDFDNHEKGSEAEDYANKAGEWRDEIDALRKVCEINGIKPLVERSRSGRGAHLWIFFKKAVSADLARYFGTLLLNKGAESINLKSFHYYDRMYPTQDQAKDIGNLIALPLQGSALKNGNSAFVDSNWNAYPDQWDILLNQTKKLSAEEVELLLSKWQTETPVININERQKPWRKQSGFSNKDVIGKMHIVLSDGLYVDALNLMPRIQNQIRSMAVFDNPEYYKNKRLGYSNYYNFSTVYLGKDIDGYIRLPRGLREDLLGECKKAKIDVDVVDEREKGRPIRVKFKGKLRVEQDLAAQALLTSSDGVLNAATAFGKTVVCSYLIAERKVNTLILLQSKDLMLQWVDELNKFLEINEEPPVYETRTGRKKKRKSVIGMLSGDKNTLTGIVDVAMTGSLYAKGKFNERLNSYGMVIMDECHHAASITSMELLQKINSRFVYGVSATPKRSDDMDKVIFMMLGPVRHKFTAIDRTREQGIDHFVVPRYTRLVDTSESLRDINKAYDRIAENDIRNQMIAEDVRQMASEGHTPIVLTRYKEHAKQLYSMLNMSAEHVYLMSGDNTDKENTVIRMSLKSIPDQESVILIATGQKIGEGFDFPRADVLMLAAPVSFEGRLEQYVGRLNRDYESKQAVYVYDYIDMHMKLFNRMYGKRLKTYKHIGFVPLTDKRELKQNANAIFDSGNYTDVFERDLIEANKSIIISSSNITQNKVERFIYLIKARQEAGASVTVITEDPENIRFGNPDVIHGLISRMKEIGISVILKSDLNERFAVIDEEIAWHGGANLLGREDAWDNLIRIKDKVIAMELMQTIL